MLIEHHDLLALLRLPPGTAVEAESAGIYPSLTERVTAGSGAERRTVILRTHMAEEMAANQAAVAEALARAGFAATPTLIAIRGLVTVEEEVAGMPGLALQPSPPALIAVLDALAALHSLPLREGLRFEQPAQSLIEEELPLYRLGFASFEREAAAPALAEARERLLETPLGFVHGEMTADRALLGPNNAWLVDFSNAGFGVQYMDVAAFLLTSGESGPRRKERAMQYLDARGLAGQDLKEIEAAELLWGLHWLLGLSRRLVLAYEDESATASLSLLASRIDRGMREGWGLSPLAREIRRGLWPG